MRRFQSIGILAVTMALLACGCSKVEKKVAPAKGKPGDSHAGHDHAKSGGATHDHSGWWCTEHGIPEEECSMCSAKVEKECKAKGDWCNEHDRAKSQCFKCDPKLKDKFAAKHRAKFGTEPPPIDN